MKDGRRTMTAPTTADERTMALTTTGGSRTPLVKTTEGQSAEGETVEGQIAAKDGQTDWAWVRPYNMGKFKRINVYSKQWIIGEVSHELPKAGTEALMLFRASCFGHLLDFHQDGQSCNAALHGILSLEVTRRGAGKHELWFRVGSSFARFSHYEYALVTGLSFRPSRFDPYTHHGVPSSSPLHQHFDGERVPIEHLRSEFKSGVFRHDIVLQVKVAKMLVLYFFLFGNDRRKAHVDNCWWALLEDELAWESFCWGSFTFQELLHYMREATYTSPRYHIYGFQWAIQAWFYEAVPRVGAVCGIIRDVDATPRVVRWKFPKHHPVLDFLWHQELEVHETLTPTSAEMAKPYWEHIGVGVSGMVPYRHPVNPLRDPTKVGPAALSNCEHSNKKALDGVGDELRPSRRNKRKLEGPSKRTEPLEEEYRELDEQTFRARIEQRLYSIMAEQRAIRADMAALRDELRNALRDELRNAFRTLMTHMEKDYRNGGSSGPRGSSPSDGVD